MTPWTFVHVADIQPGSPRSYRYNPSWIENWHEAKRQIVDINPDLLLIGGDITRDGNIHDFEFHEMKKEFADLPFPYHAVPGNMDAGNKHTREDGLHRQKNQCTDLDLNVTSDQLQNFSTAVGPLWWSFVHKNVRFSGLADMAINSRLPEEEQFWKWAEALKSLPKVDHHVWTMHYAVFADDPAEPDWKIDAPGDYTNWYFCIDQPGRSRLMDLFKATGTDIVISGHIHCHKVTYADGIRFEISPATCFGQWGDRWPDGDASLGFLRYDVDGPDIHSTFVPLAKTYNIEGYGPSGHPAPSARDYSLAWEK